MGKKEKEYESLSEVPSDIGESYRALFEESKDGIFVADIGGGLTDINTSGVALLGYESKEELLKAGSGENIIFHHGDRKRLEKTLQEEGRVKDFEMEIRRRDDQKLVIQLTATVLRNNQRNLSSYRGILRDVTEQRNLEQQLLQSQKMEAVGFLAGGVAHDFNNLLMVILGNVELGLVQEGLSPFLFNALSKIQEGAKKASDLVLQLLAFSRRQALQRRGVNLVEQMSLFSKMISRLIGEDIDIRMEFGAMLSPVYLDPAALDQILMNLSVNAREAMPRGGELIFKAYNVILDEEFCRHHPTVSSGEYVQISVTDTGIGMSEETLQRIFEPFFTTKEKGNGFGLAVVFGIVKQHGGHILATSELGKGSRLDIFFPPYKESPAQKPAEILFKDLPRGKETILIAEDEKDVRDLFETFLEGLGYNVLLAGDGEEALNIFSDRREAIDLAILDAVMPKLSGPKVYKEMQALVPNVLCLFLTGYSKEVIQKHFDQEINVPVLRKPVTFQELGVKVRNLLDQRLGSYKKG
jgi:two-component system, cell cycle sensor histidine kinase and response regulator CckA